MATALPSPLTLTLSAAGPGYAAGQLPDLKATLTNRAKRPVTICAYMLGPRILSTVTAEDEEGNDYELYPFKPGRWSALKPTDFKSIPPGKAFSIRLPIASSQVWGFVRSGSQPPLITNSHALKGFAAGEVTFRARLSDQVAIYVGKAGAYDRNWEWKKAPDELPDAPNPLPKIFRRAIKGRGMITFG